MIIMPDDGLIAYQICEYFSVDSLRRMSDLVGAILYAAKCWRFLCARFG